MARLTVSHYAILRITDGTSTVNLLHIIEGYAVEGWRQAIARYKRGGIWQSSSLAHGRRLVSKSFEDAVEEFPIPAVSGAHPNLTTAAINDLLNLCEKASDYWVTSWQDEPVWIEARAVGETVSRYAIVKSAGIPEIGDIFSPTFYDDSAMPDLTLEVVREHWREVVPGGSTAIEIGATEEFASRDLGNVDSTGTFTPTTAQEVYLANKRNVANLTNVYGYQFATDTWSGNKMNAALPYTFLNWNITASDAIYFGINTAFSDSGPFCSLVLNIGTAQSNLFFAWEYWNGADWDTLDVQDNTDAAGVMTGEPFDTTGVNSVHWAPEDDWAAYDPGVGVTGWWVRARVTSVTVPGTGVSPTQQLRDVYSIIWPYTEINADQIGGTVSALARWRYYVESDNTTNQAFCSRLIMGLRSTTRGTGFTAYINLADEQNPGGIEADVVFAVTNSSFVSLSYAPSGRACYWNPAGAETTMDPAVRVAFTSAIIDEFYGTYHAYLRYNKAGSTTVTARLTLNIESGLIAGTTSQVWVGDTFAVTGSAVDNFAVLDLGIVTLPPGAVNISGETDVYENVYLFVEMTTDAGTPQITMYDLILIPTDEWAADFITPLLSVDTEEVFLGKSTYVDPPDVYLDVDSILYPKSNLRGLSRFESNDQVMVNYITIPNGDATLQVGATQRLWVVGMRVGPGNADWLSEPWLGATILGSRCQRYLGARGE